MENTEDTPEDMDVESRAVRAARLTFLGSLVFWPLFLFAAIFLLAPAANTAAAKVERRILIDVTWVYPLAVAAGWYWCRRGIKRGASDFACLLPWLIPTLLFGYWLVYFLL
ncbi:MAG: hypothetical protein ACHQ5A_05920 [Opitutales bacterium]